MIAKEKCFDFVSNSLNSSYKEIYRDQFGEFVCGYWDLRVNVREREKIEKDQDLKCEIKVH